MSIIKQNFLNILLLNICFFSLLSCQTPNQEVTPKKQIAVKQPLEIAILMPLTGENSAIGKQYNTLIKMGIEDGLQTYAHVTSYDGSDEKQVLAAMEKIIARNSKIILGPLYSNLTTLIANKAKAHNIIVITMSNNPVLADSKLFVFGHAPLKQLTKIINYFVDINYKHFIALLPAGQYSHTVNQVIQNILIQKNATLMRSEFYSNVQESIEKAVVTVAATVDNLNEREDVQTKPVIYISDDSKNISLLFASISKHNLWKKAVIIGDNRIDIDYPEPIDIAFTGSLNVLNSVVAEKAKNIGIRHLTFMHTMAYDLGKITAQYIGTEFTQRSFLAAMNNNIPYIGISGNIHFVDSIAQREYDIITKENNIYNTMSNN
ncbi:penicillin-binding protein activator [Candidatus Tisiphia endosymbiont of Nemotelus uliginosus]|uniref:penicillin-binding protein activator n=1 Tax=Candidatus Tisiphia endosymbiont of Nemotelus uliginosus TaxID=3077926 RepID=UPI0035C916A3